MSLPNKTNSWREMPIGALCQGIFDGPHATPKKTASGPVFLGISSLNKGRLDLSHSEHLSEQDFPAWTRRVTPQAGDIVFSYETRLGEAAMIPEGLRCCLGRRLALMRPDPTKVDPHFLLFAYLAPPFQRIIQQRTIAGSTVERILLEEFPNYPLWVPSVPEQRAIGRALKTLDDKIELNHQTNETLEATARAMFQAWFVDFGPVAHKAAGRPLCGLDADINALFPERLIESAAGPIPAGWRVGTVADLCSTQYGYTTAAIDKPLGPHLLRVTDINKLPWIEWDTVPYCRPNPADYERYRLQIGDILVSRMADPGKAGIVETTVDALFASYLIRLRTPPDQCYFLFYFLRSEQYLEYVEGTMSGTVQQNMNARLITAAPIVIPPREIMARFSRKVEPIRQRLNLGLRQSRTLAALRDMLLPRLMSREIRLQHTNTIVDSENGAA